MSNTLDILQLRSFVAIADCGGFGRAAAALHLSQSTVSQHVRILERRLDQELVRREGRQARLTPAGEALLAESRRILAVHDEALERLDVTRAGTIAVGAAETVAARLLPELLEDLHAACPERTVQFRIDGSTQMTDAVAKGAVDLAVILDTADPAPGTEVGALPLNWYAAPQWSPPPTDLPLPLVAYVEPGGMRRRALRALEAAGRRVAITAESGSLEGVVAAARAGLGVAVLPTADGPPAGLTVRSDLPELGTIRVRLLARLGFDREVEAAALAALSRLFAPRGTFLAQGPEPAASNHALS